MRAAAVKASHTGEAALILPGFLLQKSLLPVSGGKILPAVMCGTLADFNLVKLFVTTCGRIFL